MYLLKNYYQKLFKTFLLFAIMYNGYRYFFEWDRDGISPSIPLYVSILKDIPWAIVVLFGLYCLYRNNKITSDNLYKKWDNYNRMAWFFAVTHLVLLAVAIIHLSHKNPIDILQRDIKNVQYIFLPFLFPLIIKKGNDIFSYVDFIVIIGGIASIVGYIIFLFMPEFTWESSVLSTFQTPYYFGAVMAMLLIIQLARILADNKNSLIHYLTVCMFYGSILLSASFTALVSASVGILIILIMLRPNFAILAKVSVVIIISSLLFYNLGFFNKYLDKGQQSIKSYNLHAQKNPYEEIQKSSDSFNPNISWKFFSKPYIPKGDNIYQFNVRYTSISARKAYLMEIIEYLQTADKKDILLGNFSLRNHFGYDNDYFYFIKNDGIIIAVLFFALFCSGFFIGLRKFTLFIKYGNKKMAGLTAGITAFLFVSTIIQFNLTYILTIYPHNVLTYFFLILIFFINPIEYRADDVNTN